MERSQIARNSAREWSPEVMRQIDGYERVCRRSRLTRLGDPVAVSPCSWRLTRQHSNLWPPPFLELSENSTRTRYGPKRIAPSLDDAIVVLRGQVRNGILFARDSHPSNCSSWTKMAVAVQEFDPVLFCARKDQKIGERSRHTGCPSASSEADGAFPDSVDGFGELIALRVRVFGFIPCGGYSSAYRRTAAASPAPSVS